MIKENNPHSHHSQRQDSLREVLSLPKYGSISSTNFVVDLITEDQVSEMFCMICEAMKHGDGYGVDEYKTEADFLEDINGGPSFAVMNQETGKMVAGFALAHSKYYRGAEIRAVDPVIIVRKTERRQGLGEYIFQTCIQFAKQLSYVGMYADTFTNNAAMMKIIEKRPSFEKVGTLPLGGRMPDGSVVGMNLYYMDLTLEPERSPQEVAE